MVNFNFDFFGWKTGRLDWQTSFFYSAWNFEMFSNFFRFLGLALRFLCVPEERLHRERIHLENQHRLQLEQLREAHENFWNRWNADRNFSVRLRDSREKITSQRCTLEELQQLYRRKQEVELQTAEKRYRFQLHLLELRQIELAHHRWVLSEGLLRARL